MTVRIDRFQINEDDGYGIPQGVRIDDYLYGEVVAGFCTRNKELNIALAKIVLDALNREFEDR